MTAVSYSGLLHVLDLSLDMAVKCSMPRIHVLPVELRNKIAAGEVIERPASVVKELIENSLDAGSTDIRIEVLKGGKGLIKVVDNGVGMDREDALLCLQRHATSKLRDESDLFNIGTMGFRGEALPSIASVSKIRLVTGMKDSPPGVAIEVLGGEIRDVRDFPAGGTSVEVRDLFFNTPARKKFLKTDGTELFHIIDIVTKEALSHPETGFFLAAERHDTMSLPRASTTRERILQIYGLEFVEGLLELRAEKSGLGMTSYVTKNDQFRNTRSHQFLFVNGRPVKDQTLSHAVYNAYEGILPPDKHPVFFLYIDIDPRSVDVNVHPTKREVRFEKKDDIHRFVSQNLREAIRRERASYVAPFIESREATTKSNPPLPPHSPFAREGGREGSPRGFVPGSSLSAENLSSVSYVSEPFELPYRPSLPYIYLGDTFIATAGGGGLMLIDHHAAHERVLYERLLKGIHLDSHQLLFPRQVKLSPGEHRVILENRGLLQEMGIEIDDFGHDSVVVRSLPEALKESDVRGILADAAGAVLEGVKPDKSLREEIAARIACHSSVRGKAILSEESVRRLLSDLEKTENPEQCPHGRPTRLFSTLDDLKKMFKRK